MVASENLDIIGITESWINEETRDFIGEYELPGYKLFKKDRTNKKGGGVLLYIRDTLNPIDCNISTARELIGVKINSFDINMHIFLVYRPPHQSQVLDDDLYGRLGLETRNKLCIILGDFNASVDWDTRASTSYLEGSRLLEFVNSEFLHQWVDKPTRGNNTLDLVLSTEDNQVTNISIGESLGKSDHNIIRFQINIPHKRESKKCKQADFRRANFTQLCEEIENLSYEQNGNIDNVWNSFLDMYTAKRASCVPDRQITTNGALQPRWFNRDIANKIKERNKAHKLLTTQPTQARKLTHKKLCREVDKLVKEAKRSEEKRVALACKSNPKEFYSYVNSRKPIKNSIGPLKDEEGALVSSDLGKANLLNKYFTNVFSTEDNSPIPEPAIRYEGPQVLDKITFSVEDIIYKIKKLKLYKSPGPDELYPYELSKLVNEISPHFYKIYSLSANQGKAPLGWKLANVAPIFKKGSRDIPGNYRPISLTSVACKIFESIIANLIVEHLERNNLLLDTQHGFRHGRSCLSNLLEFFHDMFSVYDYSRAIDVIYLDFQKAFDKVPHKKLMKKVRALGIVGEVADWIEDWLSNRKQRVLINGECSEWTNVTSGVPQGSVLGPLLFLIYINDIDIGLTSKISKFADDTKLGINANNKTDIEELKADLRKLGDWSETWQMPFNVDKCKVMHIGYRNPQIDYSLLGSNIQSVDQEEDLGVTISKDFKFSKQCLKVEKKSQKLIGYIKRQFKYRNKDVVLQLYTSLVRPHLEYAVQFWSPSLQKDISRLEAVQARATKLIPSIRQLGYQRRLNRLNLYSLETRRLRGQLIETFKIVRGFTKIDVNKLFTLSNNQTRSNGFKMELKRYNTSLCGNFLTYKICETWNSLPADIVNSSSVDEFKRKLDKIINTL